MTLHRLPLALLAGTLLAACGTDAPTLPAPADPPPVLQTQSCQFPIQETLADGTVVVRCPYGGSGG